MITGLEDDVTTMTHTELQDGDRLVHFDGTLIGHASLEFGTNGWHKPRWTEYEIYPGRSQQKPMAKAVGVLLHCR